MPPDRLLIWGGGGHGRVVADLVRAAGHQLIGFVDADRSKVGQIVEPGGGRVILTETELCAALERGAGLPPGVDAVVLALGDNHQRWAAHLRLGRYVSQTVVHPSASISPSASFGAGTVVFPNAVVNAAARIGEAAIVNSGVIVEHDCAVGDATHISPGAVLAGAVRVGARCWIGARAVVLPRITIGDGSIVGAGAVVTRDVEDGATVMGVPARPAAP